MKYDKFNRRFFLQGLGGSLMALPILPSILPRAHAQTLPNLKFLVMFGTGHGGVGEVGDWGPMAHLDPDSAVFNRSTMFATGGENNIDYVIRHARLNNLLTSNPGHLGGNVDNSQERLSFILGSFLNPYLDKMNFYNGIDIGTFYSGHHRGVFSGNIAAAVNNPEARAAMYNSASLDQFLGDSPKFYSNANEISLKVITNNDNMSHRPDGTRLPATASRIADFYQRIFGRYENNASPVEIAKRQKKEFLVDRVYEDYKRLLSAGSATGRRISSVDKQRVEQHVSSLYDLQNKYKHFVSSCGDVTGPNPGRHVYLGNHRLNPPGVGHLETYDMLTDLITSAYSCGATRISGISLPQVPLGYSGDYHQEVVHQHITNPAMQLLHNQNIRWTAEHIVTPLLRKLDSVSVSGQSGSILDNGAVTWTHECGRYTHNHDNVGLVTFGSLGGYFKTGNFVDYKNYANLGLLRDSFNKRGRPGIPIQRFWATILQGFGINRSEFERDGRTGYGDTTQTRYPLRRTSVNQGHNAYEARVMNSLSDPLPIVT